MEYTRGQSQTKPITNWTGSRASSITIVNTSAPSARLEKSNAQREVFRFFLGLVEKKQLPAVIHSRRAVDEVLEVLSSFHPPKVLLHWYTGPVNKLPLIEDNGYFITVGPSVAYSGRIVEIARKVNLNTILSETDGPVQYRGPYEGKTIKPSLVIDVVRKLAEIRSERAESVRYAVWCNFQRLIGNDRGLI